MGFSWRERIRISDLSGGFYKPIDVPPFFDFNFSEIELNAEVPNIDFCYRVDLILIALSVSTCYQCL